MSVQQITENYFVNNELSGKNIPLAINAWLGPKTKKGDMGTSCGLATERAAILDLIPDLKTFAAYLPFSSFYIFAVF